MIPFIDLAAQQRLLRAGIDRRIAAVLDHGAYIGGPEVAELEAALSRETGARHVIGCANGTDALHLALRAHDIGPGDAVVVPAFTFAATAEAVALVGATPVFADVRPHDANICPENAGKALEAARQSGLRPRAIIAVDLFGTPADYGALKTLAARDGLELIADAAQSLGASRGGQTVGTLAPVTTTSFFPAKPLGCYGDGGAIFTDDAALAARLRSLAVHGKGRDKYDNQFIGLNSRLDTLQAAILLEKLSVFGAEVTARNTVAARYRDGLADSIQIIAPDDSATSVWAQFTLVTASGAERERIRAALERQGVPSAVYYGSPLNHLPAYRDYPVAPGGCRVAEDLASCVISLPMHPYLEPFQQDQIIDAVNSAQQYETVGRRGAACLAS